MFKRIAFTFTIKIIIALLNLAIVVMLSRYIGAAGKGEASLIVTSIAMVLLFCNLIGGSSLVYFVPRYNIFQLFILSNVWSVIVCLVCLLLFLIFPMVHVNSILPVILLSLINSFLATNLTILLGKEKIKLYNFISLLQTLINTMVLILLIKGLNQNNINSYIYSLYAAMGACLIISTFFVYPLMKKDETKKDKAVLSKLFQFGLYGQAGHIMKFMSFRCTFYLLANYSGEVTLGVFSNGIALIESVFLISNSIATILYPKVANSTDKSYSQMLSLQLTKFSILLCLAALIPLILLPSAFFVALFGSEFSGVHQVILLLAPGVLFYNVALVLGHYFSGIGKLKVNTQANFIGLLTTLFLAWVHFPHYGITEVGIISTVSYFTTTALIIFYFMKEAKIKIIQLFPTYKDYKWLQSQAKTLFVK